MCLVGCNKSPQEGKTKGGSVIRQIWKDELTNCTGKYPKPPLKPSGIDRQILEEENFRD